jgi:HlyD family type I secretion membrane fusion protein
VSTPHSTFASLFVACEADPHARAELKRQSRRALIPLAVTACLLVLWSCTAPLSGAIIALGKLKVELNRKTVQHQEGGIVQRILVRDGQRVRAGQPLVVVADVRNDAELNMIVDQLNAERIRNARASAEAALAARFEAPADIADNPAAREHLARETALFEARRKTLDEQIEALEVQMRDAQVQARALTQQIESTEVAARLASEELGINQKLARDGFIQRARVLELQRAEADYRSRLAESHSDLALARQRIGELQARIVQARNQFQQQATDEAREAAANVRELEERARPSRDQVERQYVRAPVDGQVMSLRVSAVGEAIGPRDPILDIVPLNEKLVVEANIRPQDINHVRVDSLADVRLSAFDARTTPLLPGKVVFVSPDRITSPETNESWFVATVEVDAAALKDHAEISLKAGMPAELFVRTPERTLFESLVRPLNAFASRAMREP